MKLSNAAIWILVITTLSCSRLVKVESNEVIVQLNNTKINVQIPEQAIGDTNLVGRLIASNLKSEVLDAKIREAGVTVSPQKLSRSIDLYFAEAGVTSEEAVAATDRLKAIVDALKAVVLRGEIPMQVYEQRLRDSIHPEEWNAWLQEYNTKEKIEKLEKSTPDSLVQMKQLSEQSLEKDLETWLLLNRVTASIKPSRTDIRSTYKRMYPSGTPHLSEVEAEVKKQATDQARQDYLDRWWKEVISKQKIEVPAEYREAVYVHLEMVPSPILPESRTPDIAL